jgi:AGCS family alanine or glycine:cation symporter
LIKLLEQASNIVWGPPMLILLVGTHLFLTVRLRFIQRYLGKAIRISLQRHTEGEGDVSQFAALTTALAATRHGQYRRRFYCRRRGRPRGAVGGSRGVRDRNKHSVAARAGRITSPKGEAGGPCTSGARNEHRGSRLHSLR